MKIYAAAGGAFFNSVAPPGFLCRTPALLEPALLRRKPPTERGTGTPWAEGDFRIVQSTTEILPGFYVVTTRSDKPGTVEMNEVSLAIRTPEGLAVVVGCSHPGVEKILENVARIEPRLHTVTGGFTVSHRRLSGGRHGSPRLAARSASVARALHERLGRRFPRPFQRAFRLRGRGAFHTA